MTRPKPSLTQRLKNIFIGSPRKLDSKIFHKISLIAFFAWVGLGADGLSSSCYGPEEAFRMLQGHPYLGVFVALATMITVFVIGASYSQIVELFPTGGGGYIVASKLVSPKVGMISGCALLIDYALTITVSIAAGAAAIFSFLPLELQSYKLAFAMAAVIVLTLMNLRGVKESVLTLAPIFLTFIVTHVFLIIYVLHSQSAGVSTVVDAVHADIQSASAELGFVGMLLLILRAFTMGAGTYTGLEAVSNGLPILREPRVKTAKRTMHYMQVSLAFTAGGLLLAYAMYAVGPQAGKTFNAILFEDATASWSGNTGHYFVIIALIAEAALLFVGAQAGFLDGPRILSNMALDSWVPRRFALLSDRFVNQNGILIMGGAALALMLIAGGSISFLIVLYSINVFVTFTLSNLGVTNYFWSIRRLKVKQWLKKFLVALLGLSLTAFILVSVLLIKFSEGGWLTILVTGATIAVAIIIKRHYMSTAKLIEKLDDTIMERTPSIPKSITEATKNITASKTFDPNAKTAVLIVNEFNGMGLHALANIIRMFGNGFRNFIFINIGIVDTEHFKGADEVEQFQKQVKEGVEKYVNLMRRNGYYAEGISSLAVDIVDEVSTKIAPKVVERFPNSVFFGGQIVFPNPTLLSRLLYNYRIFAMQRRLYQDGVPFVIIPIHV
jgi:amino acid transporter